MLGVRRSSISRLRSVAEWVRRAPPSPLPLPSLPSPPLPAHLAPPSPWLPLLSAPPPTPLPVYHPEQVVTVAMPYTHEMLLETATPTFTPLETPPTPPLTPIPTLRETPPSIETPPLTPPPPPPPDSRPHTLVWKISHAVVFAIIGSVCAYVYEREKENKNDEVDKAWKVRTDKLIREAQRSVDKLGSDALVQEVKLEKMKVEGEKDVSFMRGELFHLEEQLKKLSVERETLVADVSVTESRLRKISAEREALKKEMNDLDDKVERMSDKSWVSRLSDWWKGDGKGGPIDGAPVESKGTDEK